jgi:hypothetical protein
MLSTGSKIAAAVIAFGFALFGGTAAADTTVLSENFQTTPTGPLGPPWIVGSNGSADASTAVVVDTPDHGRALNLRGNTINGAFLTATRTFSLSATEAQYSFAVNASPGSAFVAALHGTGTYSSRRIRLQQAAGSTTLVAQASSGATNCGSLTPGAWSTVTLRAHETVLPHTFDVLINGAPTCTGLATNQRAPFTGISVMDPANEGFGGSVLFDDLLVTTP